MALLARESQQRFTTQGIAGRLGASGHHLAKVMQRLAKAGLVGGTRGPQGGFQLARPAEETKLLEIYEAVEGPLSVNGCLLARAACDGKTQCDMGEIFGKVHQLVVEYLSRTTLAELAGGAAFWQQDPAAAADLTARA